TSEPAQEKKTSGSKKGQRRPAPWESVATPDTIPEPNPDADKDSPLYGQHVTLTGDFEPFDKGVLWNGIAHQAAKSAKMSPKRPPFWSWVSGQRQLPRKSARMSSMRKA